MKVLAVGDIVGENGLEKLKKTLPESGLAKSIVRTEREKERERKKKKNKRI